MASVKLTIFPQNRAGMTHAMLRQYLQHHHGPLCLANSDVSGRFERYVHHYIDETFPMPGGFMPLEGRGAITLITFKNMADLAASKQSAGYLDVVGPDEDNFRNEAGSQALFVEEQNVTGGEERPTLKAFVLRNVTDDPREFTRAHAARLHEAILAGELPVPDRLIVNASTSDEAMCDFNQYDEISFADRESLYAFLVALPVTADATGGAPQKTLIVCNTVIFK